MRRHAMRRRTWPRRVQDWLGDRLAAAQGGVVLLAVTAVLAAVVGLGSTEAKVA